MTVQNNLSTKINVGISARHVHLSKEDVEKLFGVGYQLTIFKNLSQTGEFASNEKISIVNENGSFENVRVLGPIRPETQVEISKSDSRTLKLSPPVRNSGDLDGSAPVTLVGPKGTVDLKQGCIIATRHIHMAPKDAEYFNVVNNQIVSVGVNTEKGGTMNNVYIKVKDTYVLELHVDTDDANAFLLNNNDKVDIILL